MNVMIMILFFAVFWFVVMTAELLFPDKNKIIIERMQGYNIYGFTEKERKKSLPLYERIYKQMEEVVIRRFGEQLAQGKGLAPLQIKLYQAGSDLDPVQHRAKRFIFALVFGALAMLTYNYRLVIVAAVVGFIFPDYQLRKKMDERKMKIKEELPDFCDLLAAVFPGCNGLEDALHKICSRYDTIISREFQRVLDMINAGVSKKEALRDLAKRCGVQEVDNMVSQILQTEMLGTEMAETLKLQAAKMREMKRQLAEIKARRATVTLLLPTFFLLIAILIVLAGPAVVQLFQAWSAF